MLKDFIGPFFLSGAIMAGILLLDKVFLLVDLLVRKGVNIALVGELMLSSLPFVLSFCVPMGVLIASVMVFGRLVHDNELTAIRSSGINPMRLFRPLLFFVTSITIIMIFFNGYVLPEASHHARNLITDIAQKKPAVRIYENAFLDDFPGYIIYIGSIDERTGKVNDITIWQKNDFSTPTLIKAKTGRIITSPDQKYITIDLDAGEISELITKDKYRHLAFSSHQINLPIDDEFSRRERKYRSDREMVLYDLYAHTRSISKDIKNLNKDVAKYKQTPENEVSKYRYDDAMTRLRYKHNEFNQYATEIEKKYALACSCLIFLFFGAGLGLMIKRSGLGFGFVTGLLFFAVYYIILIAGEEFADAGRITPFIGIWFANLILIPVTLLLLSSVGFETNFTKKLLHRAK